MARSITNQRLVAQLSTFFGLLAVFLSCIGIYGVMSYVVTRRTNEIGIRMALGAARSNMIWMVLREILILVSIGVVIGVPVALAGDRLVSNMLFGLRPTDPVTLVSATVILLIVAAIAGYCRHEELLWSTPWWLCAMSSVLFSEAVRRLTSRKIPLKNGRLTLQWRYYKSDPLGFRPITVEALVVRRQVRQNGPPQFQNVDEPCFWYNTLPSGAISTVYGTADSHVGSKAACSAAVSLESKSRLRLVACIFCSTRIHRIFLVRHVGRDRDQFEIAHAVHPVGVFNFGKLMDAGAAPGCPEADQHHLLVGIAAQLFQIRCRYHFQVDGL